MKLILTSILSAMAFVTAAQKQSFDIVSYLAPDGWKEETTPGGNIRSLTKTDNATGNWCVINIIKSTNSKGSVEEDFKSEWDQFAVKQYNATGLSESEVEDA
ncbi:MAG TPA: hypothetical protein PLR74_00580, partial [Agriterribacter sp.]|nr:hypothetical protein [Agriterribacter sp.]